MYLCRRLNQIKHCSIRRYCLAAEREELISIPNRIQRSPTDMLRALANTVEQDPTAPHYKYHDDPYLIPSTNINKRTYAMALEAGKKAAFWIKEEHRNLFMHQIAEPSIKAFAPKPVYTENSEVDENILQSLIRQLEVEDSIQVYNALTAKGINISQQAKQSLLDLICFYNNQSPLSEEYLEERWFKKNLEARDRSRKSWQDGGLAEELFGEIIKETPTSGHAYAALIRGMSKYYQAERAYALLQEATEKSIPLDTTTFNSVLNIANFLRDTVDERWNLCCDLLGKMNELQLKPNLGTMNAVLQCISTFGSYRLARDAALKTLAEFKSQGIEPSLGTYYYTLIIFCKERGPVSHVIVDILKQIEGKSLKLRHPKDTYFFATAMDVCRNHLHDRSLARKVDALLHTGNNYILIGDTYKESVYYRHYFALLCQTEPIEEFMQSYDLLVPHVYIPEPGIMEELLKAIEISSAIDYIPRVWSDIVVFDHVNRESLVLRLLKIMIENRPNLEVASQKDLPKHFANIAFDIFNKGSQMPTYSNSRKVAFTGQMIGDILTLLVRADDFENALQVFVYLDKNQHRMPGTPTEECLLDFVDCCVANRAPTSAMQCFQYAVDNNMDVLRFVKRIRAGLTLDENHLAKLKAVVGEGNM